MTIEEAIHQAEEIGVLQVRPELEEFAAFLSRHPFSTALEIGSNRGGLLWLIRHLASGDPLCISVDLPTPGPYSTGVLHPKVRELPGVVRVDGSSFSPETLASVKAALGGRALDLLVIDGDHRFPDVDHAIYGPLVRPGGWVAFHDIADSQRHRHAGCAVARYFRSLTGYKVEIWAGEDWGGWGLHRVPPTPPGRGTPAPGASEAP